LKKFLRGRVPRGEGPRERNNMINPVGQGQKTYSMKDVYSEAMKLMKEEVASLKKAPLTAEENLKMEQIAKAVSNQVIKEMRI